MWEFPRGATMATVTRNRAHYWLGAFGRKAKGRAITEVAYRGAAVSNLPRQP